MTHVFLGNLSVLTGLQLSVGWISE